MTQEHFDERVLNITERGVDYAYQMCILRIQSDPGYAYMQNAYMMLLNVIDSLKDYDLDSDIHTDDDIHYLFELANDVLRESPQGIFGFTWLRNTSGLRDIDGNLYTSVIIGNQEWMVENLRVIRYSDNSFIPNLTLNSDWAAEDGSPGHNGAYCWHSNSIDNKEIYGALYNAYAIENAKELVYIERDGVQEIDWRIPTLADFNELKTYLDPDAGDKIKEVGDEHWLSIPPNVNTGTNETGFTARGGNSRGATGNFAALKEWGIFWGDTIDANNLAMFYLNYVSPNMTIFSFNTKAFGASIRLVRDVTVSYVNVVYGMLYNQYVVTDARNIANTSWRIPTNADCQTLATYLGGELTAGGRLKESGLTHWLTPNTDAINDVGFNGRGNGARTTLGVFLEINEAFRAWQNDNIGGGLYTIMTLYYDSAAVSVIGSGGLPNHGVSMILVKEATTLSHGQTGTYRGNDGKYYRTICIGTQEWVSSPLVETKYRNGEFIPEVTDDAIWTALVTGARCNYDNDVNNSFILSDDLLDTIILETMMNGDVTLLLAGTAPITIDWGDGSAPEEVIVSADPDDPTYAVHAMVCDEELGIPNVITITKANTLTYFNVPSNRITSAIVAYDLINLKFLSLWDNELTEFETYAEWVSLENLTLAANTLLSEIETHAEWVNLEQLSVQQTSISTIVIHPEWVNVWLLGAAWNNELIEFIVPSTLINLRMCFLNDTSITEFTTHPEWANLEILNINTTDISSLETHAEWTKIVDIAADSNGLISFIAYDTWVLLETLYLRWNALADVNAILIALNNAGVSNATINLTGGTNAVPSGAGIAASNALVLRGCSVQTNV